MNGARGSKLDVIIVGGGPAGLSAALLLGRCCRNVLVCDAQRPRNARADALHGFLTRDGSKPAEIRRLARAELAAYPNVSFADVEVVAARCDAEGFRVQLADGRELQARKLLLATGVVDALPRIAGIEALYGHSVHHCPYCDGWEQRGRALAAYGKQHDAVGLAFELLAWSDDVVLCSDGAARFEAGEREELARCGIAVREDPIARVEGVDGRLSSIVFADGTTLAREALFFATAQHQHSELALSLGCGETAKGAIDTRKHEATVVPGLYVAGDASPGEQLVVVAASEGAQAAISINRELLEEDRARLTRAGVAPALRDEPSEDSSVRI